MENNKEPYIIECNIDSAKIIKVGEVYERIDFAWTPEKVEGKWIWWKQYKTIIKLTKIYPHIWGVSDTEFDYDVIETKLIKKD